MQQLWERFLAQITEQGGATMVEYAIMAGLIAAVSILIVTTIGLDVLALFQSLSF